MTTTTYLKWEKLYIFWEWKTDSKFGTQVKKQLSLVKIQRSNCLMVGLWREMLPFGSGFYFLYICNSMLNVFGSFWIVFR